MLRILLQKPRADPPDPRQVLGSFSKPVMWAKLDAAVKSKGTTRRKKKAPGAAIVKPVRMTRPADKTAAAAPWPPLGASSMGTICGADNQSQWQQMVQQMHLDPGRQVHLQEQQSFAVQQQFKHQQLFTLRPPIHVPTPQPIKIHSEQHQQAINISNGAMDAAIMLASLESTIISDREEEYSMQRCDTRAVQEEYFLPSCDRATTPWTPATTPATRCPRRTRAAATPGRSASTA